MFRRRCGKRATLQGAELITRLHGSPRVRSRLHSPLHEERFTCMRLGDEALHPWSYAEEREGTGLSFGALS